MAEIEREHILAGRLEEMQKFKDAQQLDAMYKMAGRAGDEDEVDEEDDEPSRKKREPTSVRFVLLTRRAGRETHQCDQRSVQGHGEPEEPPESKRRAGTSPSRST